MPIPDADTILLAITSDHHSGSTVALAPDEPVPVDDGQEIHPSKAQRWLWQCWREFWGEAERVRDEHRASLIVVHNGDLVDGPGHHGTVQSVHMHPGVEKWIAKKVLAVPQALGPDATFVVRGTESHVGKNASREDSLGHDIGAEREPETGAWSWWHLRMELQGLLLSFAHHGRTGYRPWTKPNAHNLLAMDIFVQHALAGERHPDLAVRSHFHQYGESARHGCPVQVVQTGAWQLATAFVHRVAPESLADIGGLLVLIRDGRFELRPILYRPNRGAVWKPESASPNTISSPRYRPRSPRKKT